MRFERGILANAIRGHILRVRFAGHRLRMINRYTEILRNVNRFAPLKRIRHYTSDGRDFCHPQLLR